MKLKAQRRRDGASAERLTSGRQKVCETELLCQYFDCHFLHTARCVVYIFLLSVVTAQSRQQLSPRRCSLLQTMTKLSGCLIKMLLCHTKQLSGLWVGLFSSGVITFCVGWTLLCVWKELQGSNFKRLRKTSVIP